MCVPGGESAVSRNDGCAGSWSSLVCRREEDLWRVNASGAGRRGSARRRVVRVVRLLICVGGDGGEDGEDGSLVGGGLAGLGLDLPSERLCRWGWEMRSTARVSTLPEIILWIPAKATSKSLHKTTNSPPSFLSSHSPPPSPPRIRR